MISISKHKLEKMEKLPEIGEVFGIKLNTEDQKIYRGMRTHYNGKSGELKIYLIDIGKFLKIDADYYKVKFFMLPDVLKQKPANAMLCKIVKIK